MTQASIPVLQKEPALWAQLKDKLYSDAHDPRDAPIGAKQSIMIGMGMTEKQGGSDVRANTTLAVPVGAGGRGGEHLLRGHKWFFSAPMCDAHLVVARTEAGGPSCFYVPRWRPDGTKNAVRIQRLKNKVGNRSNSSSEIELDDAWGVMLGEEGRGIPTIIEMATYTRLNCVLGSAAILRQGLVQAIAYTRQRHAFGRALAEQPLMRAVLADLALESEAALALAMRLAQAFERGEPAWTRIVAPAAKFWVCKRAVEAAGEVMEIFGGNGYVDDGPIARLFREAPVNSIWEGSGNVMCLDVMRAISREPDAAHALIDELHALGGRDARIRAELDALRACAAALSPQHVFIPDNATGDGDLGRRYAAAANASVATQVVEIAADHVGVYVDAKRGFATRTLPDVVLLAPNAVDPTLPFVGAARTLAAPDARAAGDGGDARYRDFGLEEIDAAQVALEEADFIVSAGNGVTDIAAFETLAATFGAAIGASRVAVDNGHFTRDKQVGATGKTVDASIYIAFGISGAVQHLQGIKDCRHVIAVNLDGRAPIAKRANLTIVGDAQATIAALIEAVNAARAAQPRAGAVSNEREYMGAAA